MFQILKQYTGVFGAILLMIGYCYSRVLMSIGAFLVFLQPFLSYKPAAIGQLFLQNRWIWLFYSYFLLTLITYFYTNNVAGFTNQIRVLIPFLLIPFGLLASAFYDKRNRFIIGAFLIMSVFTTGLLSFFNYLLEYSTIHEQVLKSQAVPIVTGINHIYYSVLLAFGTLLGIMALWQQWVSHRHWRWLLGTITALNFLFLHVFTARTGLGGFYFAAAIVFLARWIKYRQWSKALGSVALLGIIGSLAVIFIPTLNNKYQNTVKDINVYMKGKNPNYFSIAMRLKAWERTSQLIIKHPVKGVGPGDLMNELDSVYMNRGTLLIPKNRKGPHNQFLQSFAELGIPGFLVAVAFFIYPLYCYFRSMNTIGLAFLVLMAFAFFFESMLERQTGITFFAFWWPFIFGYPIYNSD